MGLKQIRAEAIREEIRGQMELFKQWTEEEAIDQLRSVRNYHIKYMVEATRNGLNTGTAASLLVIEKIQKIFQLMGVKGVTAAAALDEEYETARLVLGDAINFKQMAADAATTRGLN